MTEQQIRKLLQQALYKAQIDGPCYDVAKLVIQLELIISMLDSGKAQESGKDIGDIK